jgi:cbb3-type cytochrome oxidase cytochrome c subunit
MKRNLPVFLAVFLALTASWSGFVLAPQIQIGHLQPETNAVNILELYPQDRPGLAQQGLQVYRAEGCVACHSQQVGQNGAECSVLLISAGTNPVAAAEALAKVNAGIARASGPNLAAGLPKTLVSGVGPGVAKPVLDALQSAGAKAKIQIQALGPDIARHWGLRGNVALDYVFDNPVMLGSQRIGPDLANVGLRLPDANWHLRHLYAPDLDVKGSPMPPYRYLFEQRRIEWYPSPDALQLPPELAPPAGFEIVPRPEARALVAYLQSLKSDAPLIEMPVTPLLTAPAPPQWKASPK